MLKQTILNNKVNKIKFIFSFVLMISCSSAYALPPYVYGDIPWEVSPSWANSPENNQNTLVKQMKNFNIPEFITRRACGNQYEYGVIMLHGADSSSTAGIDSILDASRNDGNMNVMMEKFAYDCALVYVPGAQTGSWDAKSEGTGSDLDEINRLINHMHNTYTHNGENIKIFVIGGSSGAIMAHHIGSYHLNNSGEINLAGIVIVDGVSSSMLCAENCSLPQNRPAYSGGIVYYHQGNPNGISLFEVVPWLVNWGQFYKHLFIAGVYPSYTWSLPTLVLSSDEPWNGVFPPNELVLTPNEFKEELGDALSFFGPSFVETKYRIPGSLPHDPWTDNANLDIYDFIQNNLY